MAKKIRIGPCRSQGEIDGTAKAMHGDKVLLTCGSMARVGHFAHGYNTAYWNSPQVVIERLREEAEKQPDTKAGRRWAISLHKAASTIEQVYKDD